MCLLLFQAFLTVSLGHMATSGQWLRPDVVQATWANMVGACVSLPFFLFPALEATWYGVTARCKRWYNSHWVVMWDINLNYVHHVRFQGLFLEAAGDNYPDCFIWIWFHYVLYFRFVSVFLFFFFFCLLQNWLKILLPFTFLYFFLSLSVCLFGMFSRLWLLIYIHLARLSYLVFGKTAV